MFNHIERKNWLLSSCRKTGRVRKNNGVKQPEYPYRGFGGDYGGSGVVDFILIRTSKSFQLYIFIKKN